MRKLYNTPKPKTDDPDVKRWVVCQLHQGVLTLLASFDGTHYARELAVDKIRDGLSSLLNNTSSVGIVILHRDQFLNLQDADR